MPRLWLWFACLFCGRPIRISVASYANISISAAYMNVHTFAVNVLRAPVCAAVSACSQENGSHQRESVRIRTARIMAGKWYGSLCERHQSGQETRGLRCVLFLCAACLGIRSLQSCGHASHRDAFKFALRIPTPRRCRSSRERSRHTLSTGELDESFSFPRFGRIGRSVRSQNSTKSLGFD